MGRNYTYIGLIKKSQARAAFEYIGGNTDKNEICFSIKVDDEGLLPISCYYAGFDSFMPPYKSGSSISSDTIIDLFAELEKNGLYLYMSINLCIELDKYLLKYFENGYRPWEEKEDHMVHRVAGTTYRLGSIDTTIRQRVIDEEVFLEISFVAVTNDMSEVMVDSPNIRRWFFEFWTKTEAEMGILFKEAAGEEILFFKGRPSSFKFEGDGHYLSPAQFEAITGLYAKLRLGESF